MKIYGTNEISRAHTHTHTCRLGELLKNSCNVAHPIKFNVLLISGFWIHSVFFFFFLLNLVLWHCTVAILASANAALSVWKGRKNSNFILKHGAKRAKWINGIGLSIFKIGVWCRCYCASITSDCNFWAHVAHPLHCLFVHCIQRRTRTEYPTKMP